MGKYIVKKWFDGQWLIIAPGGTMRAICISYETAIMAMDVHALSGNFIDPELIDKDKKHV
jgi:hypothetical protein